MTALGPLLDRLQELGGEVFLDGDKARYRIPADNPEADALIEELRKDRKALIAVLRDIESKPPSLDEIQPSLQPGVKLVNYGPKQPPFAVAPVSIVTNAGKFYRAYLADLSWRLAKSEGYHCPPLADILSKLADAGLELTVEAPAVPTSTSPE